MTYLILIAASLVLLAGFYALTMIETRRGARMFAASRANLDQEVNRLTFIFTHVDFGAFAQEGFRNFVSRAGHDLAHLSLQVVRAVERLLTRAVRHLRTKGAATVPLAPREASREFVKTLSDFKGQLEATRPGLSEVR